MRRDFAPARHPIRGALRFLCTRTIHPPSGARLRVPRPLTLEADVSQRRVIETFPARTFTGQPIQIPAGALVTRSTLQPGSTQVHLWVDSPNGAQFYEADLAQLVPASIVLPTARLQRPSRQALSPKRHSFRS